MAIKFPWQKHDEPAVTWERTDIENNLTNEWNQAQVDGNFADGLMARLAERDPVAAERMRQTWEQWEREATNT